MEKELIECTSWKENRPENGMIGIGNEMFVLLCAIWAFRHCMIALSHDRRPGGVVHVAQVRARHPSAFTVRGGTVGTESVQGEGLGSRMDELYD